MRVNLDSHRDAAWHARVPPVLAFTVPLPTYFSFFPSLLDRCCALCPYNLLWRWRLRYTGERNSSTRLSSQHDISSA